MLRLHDPKILIVTALDLFGIPECVADRLDESQPPILSLKLALQIDPYSPASAIVKLCGAVRTSGRCQHRGGVDDKANVLYISPAALHSIPIRSRSPFHSDRYEISNFRRI